MKERGLFNGCMNDEEYWGFSCEVKYIYYIFTPGHYRGVFYSNANGLQIPQRHIKTIQPKP